MMDAASDRGSAAALRAMIWELADSPGLVRVADLATYQRYTRDALASATYLKRYAEAVLRAEAADAKR